MRSPGADLVAGFQDIMPPAKGSLNEAEIDEIVAYLKELK
jgi:hypothetical protein